MGRRKKNTTALSDVSVHFCDLLHNAVQEKNYEKLDMIIDHKQANINSLNEARESALEYALNLGDATASIALVKKGADLHAVNKLGLTALHILIRNIDDYIAKSMMSYENIMVLMRELVNAGASLSVQDRRGNTPINAIAQRAKANKNITEVYTRLGKLILTLDKHSSDTILVKNNMGKSPLDYLSRNGNFILRDAVYEKLPHIQERLNRVMAQEEANVKKILERSKEFVG